MNRFILCRQSGFIDRFSLHKHPTTEITLVLAGSVSVFADGKKLTLNEGDFVIMPPFTLHEGSSDGKYMDISVQIDNIDLAVQPTVLHDSGEVLKRLLDITLKIWTEKEDDYLVICETLSSAVSRYVGKLVRHDLLFPGLSELKNRVYENISNPDFSLSDAIRDTGYNDDYFRRRFKAATGETPLEYLTQLRINRACDLLLQPDYHSVEQVAALCGFSDSFYFSTCFKKHIGCPPLRYRKQNLDK